MEANAPGEESHTGVPGVGIVIRLPLIVLLAVPFGTCAQTHTQSDQTKGAASKALSSSDSNTPSEEIRITEATFSQKGQVPGITASPVISPPICGADGTPYVSVPEPPTYAMQTVYSMSLQGTHVFAYQAAPGLYDVQFLGLFASDSFLGVVVNATTESEKADLGIQSRDGGLKVAGSAYKGVHHQYIVKFGLDGSYQSSLSLPEAYGFRRVASLSDGNLVALAYDRANAVARLFLLDSSGKEIRQIQLPEAMENSPELKQGETGNDLNRARAESSISWWLFAQVRNRTLLYLSRSRAPVLEVGPGGLLREVPYQNPPGYELDAIIPSTSHWFFRFRKAESSEKQTLQESDFVVYEVDPNDGSLMRQVVARSGPGFGVACENDGQLIGLSTDSDSRYVLMVADLK